MDEIMQISLILMYAKCGNLPEAENIFNSVLTQFHQSHLCLSLWNSMMSIYADFGNGVKSLNLFEQMMQQGITPDSITFVSLLNACSRSGHVDEALQIYGTMHKFSIFTFKAIHFS